jgi:uracil-DNA glycosylase
MLTLNSPEIITKRDELVTKLHDKLRPSGWYTMTSNLLNDNIFKNIIDNLVLFSHEGKRFTPPLKYLTRSFEECSYKDLRVVFVGQDPYPQIGVADGISFSCSLKPDNKMEASLRYIAEAVNRTVYNDPEQEFSNDLKRWSNQGVLMLNTAFTTEVGQIGKHMELWKPFTVNLIEIINQRNTGLIWVFLGKQAQQYAEHVSDLHYKIFASHPASAAYAKQKQWDCNDLFNQVNQILQDNHGEKITW